MRIRSFILVVLLSISIAAMMAACATSNTEPEAVADPHSVNDLSAISSEPVAGIANQKAAYDATHTAQDSYGHAFQDEPGNQRHVGTDAMPAVEQLMNPKAAQFGQFSNSLLDKLWGQLRLREGDDDISRLRLPTSLQPVILTATLSPEGKLQEIVVEQHSGKAIVDKLFIDACKKALWTQNPPKAAAQPNGTYQVRVEGRLENFASTKENNWTFKTYMGIALL